MTKTIMLASTWSLALLMLGCGGKVRYPKYYTLELAPTLRPGTSDPPKLGTLAVRPFGTSAYLRQGRIVYREAPNEVAFYEYRRWAADPSAAVTTAVMETLRPSGLFSSVDRYDVHDKPEYLMTGRLERLDEIDYAGGVRVEVKLTARLVNLRTGITVWVGEATETSAVETRTVNSVVAADSKAVQACIAQLITGMQQKLAGAAPASSGVRARGREL
jgi:ABC-type uncharacterized transport system auxiliary subunit